ncbi:L,D-transpeptidase family protein [Leifsonia sp. NCR5]|uniref:L,D-transpeptidase family protein n=1 Tax=Leifsonia sp. NCR5 TaxID=1978342 RepID=UPI000A194518|nr:L,D-transpeptidase family protein [Leifsonia sp. NCR5]
MTPTALASRLAATAAAIAVAAAALTGCAPSAPKPSAAPHTAAATPTASSPSAAPTAAPSVGTSATATGASVDVYAQPDGAVVSTLANPIPSGAPLTFLVDTASGPWLKVGLAQRPNGSTGWVKADSVVLHSLSYSLTASTVANTLSLYRDGALVKTYSAATGTGDTPTPHGSFYVTELLAPTNEGYGPYAFGLSAFSDVLNSFGGGPGQIGLHGTDDAASIGRAVSHGCIRLANADITELAGILPLGTPITIE